METQTMSSTKSATLSEPIMVTIDNFIPRRIQFGGCDGNPHSYRDAKTKYCLEPLKGDMQCCSRVREKLNTFIYYLY
jgi:hypothetical protein